LQEGFRDGADAGRAASLQLGFNQGYKEGVKTMATVGQLKGILSALSSWSHLSQGDHLGPLAKITRVLDAVFEHEQRVFEHLNKGPQQVHAGEIRDGIEEMGLESAAETQEICNNAEQESCYEAGSQERSTCCSTQGHCRTPLECSKTLKQKLNELLQDTICLAEQLQVPIAVMQQIQQLMQ
uniref:Essential protein Yae1 N-terminal domain-containing protein n=1 Tax=Latimeria chalumnae TaxID=7897 RepID=H3AH52_LATCH